MVPPLILLACNIVFKIIISSPQISVIRLFRSRRDLATRPKFIYITNTTIRTIYQKGHVFNPLEYCLKIKFNSDQVNLLLTLDDYFSERIFYRYFAFFKSEDIASSHFIFNSIATFSRKGPF